MKKILIASLILSGFFSCSNEDKIASCQSIAESDLHSLEGFNIDTREFVSREGLKLAVPSEFESSTHISTISFVNAEKDYKGCTCYYDSNGSMMGHEIYGEE